MTTKGSSSLMVVGKYPSVSVPDCLRKEFTSRMDRKTKRAHSKCHKERAVLLNGETLSTDWKRPRVKSLILWAQVFQKVYMDLWLQAIDGIHARGIFNRSFGNADNRG